MGLERVLSSLTMIGTPRNSQGSRLNLQAQASRRFPPSPVATSVRRRPRDQSICCFPRVTEAFPGSHRAYPTCAVGVILGLASEQAEKTGSLEWMTLWGSLGLADLEFLHFLFLKEAPLYCWMRRRGNSFPEAGKRSSSGQERS